MSPKWPGQTPPIPEPRKSPQPQAPYLGGELDTEPDTGINTAKFPVQRRVKRAIKEGRRVPMLLAAISTGVSAATIAGAFAVFAWLKAEIRENIFDKLEPRLIAIELRLPKTGEVVYYQPAPPTPLRPADGGPK